MNPKTLAEAIATLKGTSDIRTAIGALLVMGGADADAAQVTAGTLLGVAQEFATLTVEDARAKGIEGYPADPDALPEERLWADEALESAGMATPEPTTMLGVLYHRHPNDVAALTTTFEIIENDGDGGRKAIAMPLHWFALKFAHIEWRSEGGKGRHPLADAVEAWLARPPQVAYEQRQTGLLPETLRHAVFVLDNKGLLPSRTQHEVGKVGETGTLPIPGMDLPAETVPELPLQGEPINLPKRKPGKGAPLERRLWWHTMSSVPAADRRTEKPVMLAVPYEVVTSRMWPGGGYRPGTHLEALRKALAAIGNLGVAWERSEWVTVVSRSFPTMATKPSDNIYFEVLMPPGSDRGAMIDRPQWWSLGAKSGALFDAWARLAYIWDAAKATNGSQRIFATRPMVWRDKDGYLRGADGATVRGPDPALSFSAQNKTPQGKPQSNWADSRAVFLDRNGGRQIVMGKNGPVPAPNPVIVHERNPRADRVPELDRRDILRLFHGANIPKTIAAQRMPLVRALKHLREELEATGWVRLETNIGARNAVESVRILQALPDDVVRQQARRSP